MTQKDAIKNEYQLMNLLAQTKPNESNERVLNLKIRITEKKKAFGDWSFKEIAREIYKNDLRTMRRFNIEDLPQLDPPIGEEEIDKQLKDKALIFKNCVNTNGATVREYISIFITIAVKHIQKHKDPTTTLSVESELEGTRGYGNLDYEIDINDVLVLVIEAKNLDIEKLTTGHIWRFIQWFGTLQFPKAGISPEIECNLCDYQKAKKVVSYIAQLLQAQAYALRNRNDENEGQGNKRNKP
ncbi:hypothetical protein F8M41_026093 [Gigaspora margarita]|uniref:Uncharacterized protein n=1 Tax=Gigaspora margarita TaxID=4874 RepID=A0A8H3XI58_GIGMA|nr:hypothetical protein F8M41_026093 [Gigaspora margarita]